MAPTQRFSSTGTVAKEQWNAMRMEVGMPARIYGIKNCDTMKKAFGWLKDHGVAYDFHDYRAEAIDAGTVAGWARAIGWEKVLNKGSTTFKDLDPTEKTDLDEARAIDLMVRYPTMIKRPILVSGTSVTAGFKADVYAGLFASDHG
jgi:arsenate reductase